MLFQTELSQLSHFHELCIASENIHSQLTFKFQQSTLKHKLIYFFTPHYFPLSTTFLNQFICRNSVFRSLNPLVHDLTDIKLTWYTIITWKWFNY